MLTVSERNIYIMPVTYEASGTLKRTLKRTKAIKNPCKSSTRLNLVTAALDSGGYNWRTMGTQHIVMGNTGIWQIIQ